MTDTTTAVATQAQPAQRQIHRVENIQPMLDSDRFEHFQRASQALMHSSILNESVRGNSPAQCFSNLMLVFDLSDRWKLPALSIAQGIAIVHNKVVYEGKLITAMLRASLGVTLHFHYTGDRGTPGYRIYVSDRDFADLDEEALAALAPDRYPRGWRMIDGAVSDWQTFQKDGRTANPAWTGAAQRNQLAYRGSREWARLYEPAQMLGVYGDDEIDDMTVRMDRARDVTPAAIPAPSTGLAGFRSAPATDESRKAVITNDQAGDAGAFSTPEKADAAIADMEQQLRDPGSTIKAGDQDKAVADGAAERRDGQVAAPAPSGAADKPKAPAKAPAKAKAAPKVDTVEDMDALLEEAYAMGRAGTPIYIDPSIKRAAATWDAMRAEWRRAINDAKAEQLQDKGPDAVDSDLGDDDAPWETTGDDALDAIAEAERELVEQVVEDHDFPGDAAPVDSIDAYTRGLQSLTDWQAIKSSLTALSRTDGWATAMAQAPSRVAEARRAAWVRQHELNVAGGDVFDFLNDLTAFRCWIETTTDEDAINGNWMTLVRMPIYTGATEANQQGLQKVVLARVETIRKGKGA